MRNIILASASPRRKELLLKFGIKPVVISSKVKESISNNETPEQVAMSLAFLKAEDVARNFRGNEIIIAADTLVYFENSILGKPANYHEAETMIKKLSGREHYVITGLSIIEVETNKKIIDFEKTMIKFRELSKAKIQRYLNTGEYKDKAGGYGIQGQGEILVEEINGCYSNVVGLPIPKLDKLLERHFNISLL